MLLKLDEITLIEGNHAREKINHKQVSQYASLMKDGVIFPPVIVFGEENILGDGWHRFFAHRLNKKTEIMAEKKDGGAREARLYSYQANNHGLPPTQKERIVNAQYLLDDPEWSSWSDAKIAVHVGLGRTTVWRMRKTVSKKQNKEIPQKTPKETVNEVRQGVCHRVPRGEHLPGALRKRSDGLGGLPSTGTGRHHHGASEGDRGPSRHHRLQEVGCHGHGAGGHFGYGQGTAYPDRDLRRGEQEPSESAETPTNRGVQS
jgi:hypothetical protein